MAKTPEGKASLDVRLRANAKGCRLYKNNTGVAFSEDNRPVFFGLGNDGTKDKESIRTPDWVGWLNVVITPEMVGKSIPVFTAIDAKKVGFIPKKSYPVGTREYGQQKFFNIVIDSNGLAGFATNAQDVDLLIYEFYRRITG